MIPGRGRRIDAQDLAGCEARDRARAKEWEGSIDRRPRRPQVDGDGCRLVPAGYPRRPPVRRSGAPCRAAGKRRTEARRSCEKRQLVGRDHEAVVARRRARAQRGQRRNRRRRPELARRGRCWHRRRHSWHRGSHTAGAARCPIAWRARDRGSPRRRSRPSVSASRRAGPCTRSRGRRSSSGPAAPPRQHRR